MKKVLVAGKVQSNFIKQLYGSILQLKPEDFQFDTLELKELSGKDEYQQNNIFHKNYKLGSTSFSSFKVFFNSTFWRIIFYFIIFKSIHPVALLKYIKKHLRYHSIYNKCLKNKYSIIHFHFPVAEHLILLWYIKKEKVVISFWGSDLMRTHDRFNFLIQSIAVQRATAITTQSTELAEIIMAKFGRKNKSKIHQTLFPPNDALYYLIDKIKNDDSYLNSLLTELNIDINKKIICIGHNANPYNNHEQIINQLNKLDIKTKNQLFFVFPFTYGNTSKSEYQDKLESQLRQVGISFCFLNDFLSWEQLAALKIKSNITIHLPDSDALSGAITEAMYAGSVLITGAWLPYSPFVKRGLKYETIDNISELNLKVIDAIENYDQYKIKISKNRNIIKNNFLSERTAATWLPIYI